jgi:transposase-like protein
MDEHGVEVDRATLTCWALKYPLVGAGFRAPKQPGGSQLAEWDESYVRVKWTWKY